MPLDGGSDPAQLVGELHRSADLAVGQRHRAAHVSGRREERTAVHVDIGSGLNPTLDTILAVNAGREKGDPQQIVKAMASLLRSRGRSVSADNLGAQGQELYDYLNASGADLAGATGMLSASGPGRIRLRGIRRRWTS